jgi:long-chain acyl-CoA synthetase
VEKVLTSHPDISDAGVLGVPDERYGEKVCALIVPNKGAVIDKKDIQLFCREKLANYKVPSYIEFRDSIPKNQLGKLLRRELPALVNPAELVEVKWD